MAAGAAGRITERITVELEDLADPEKVGPMQAYMKTEQPFLGIQATPRRKVVHAVLRQLPIDDPGVYQAVVWQLWNGSYREHQYAAIDVAQRVRTCRTMAAWSLYERMLRSAQNWDTVDPIATSLLGELLRTDRREAAPRVADWVDDDNMWLRRAALLVHLRHKEETDVPVLAATIDRLANEPEFFIRKAIGWVLREYARTDPDWVRDFVAARGESLSGLSRREALRHL